MASERLSKKEDRALHSALASVVLTAFPNLERKDCPGRETLLAIARKKLPMRDPAGHHVTRCSPCFSELRGIQSHIRRQRTVWLTAAAAAVLIAVTMVAYLAFQTLTVESLFPGLTPAPRIVLVDLRN